MPLPVNDNVWPLKYKQNIFCDPIWIRWVKIKHFYVLSIGFQLLDGDFWGPDDFEKLFAKLDENTSDFSMCRKIGRHLIVKKGSQDRQNVAKGWIFI